MFRNLTFLLSTNDPWDYLDPSSLTDDIYANNISNGALWSSIYVTLRIIGLAGAVITLIIALAKLAGATPEKRNELKNTILKKLMVIFFLFSAAYIIGSILGVFLII